MSLQSEELSEMEEDEIDSLIRIMRKFSLSRAQKELLVERVNKEL